MTDEQEARHQGEFRSEAYSLDEFREYLIGELVEGQELEDLITWASDLADIWHWEDADLEERSYYPFYYH